MVLFVLSFLAIYTGMHVLLFWGLHPLLRGHPALPTLTWAWMGLMIVAPVMVRIFDHIGWELSARGLAWVSYSWMGLLFLGFTIFVLVGFWELLVVLVRQFAPALSHLSIHGPQLALFAVILILCGGFYGLYEAGSLRIEQIELETSKLPPGNERLVIAQVSDLHLGLLHRDEELGPVVARLQHLKPDLLVATGDIVDAQISHLDGLSALWRQVAPPLGKFAVTGNHEAYAGLEQSRKFLEKSGFELLRNEGRPIGGLLTIVGVDDPATGACPDEAALLEAKGQGFTLLLKHRPRVDEHSAGRFDLQLSGHAHRGQIFPFNLLTALAYPMQDGLYELSGGGHLYTSRGTGSWGPPMRIGSPPELTIIILKRPRE